MLVLQRGRNQEITIRDRNGNLLGVVRVTAIRGDRVRLGFEGWDRAVSIDRREVDDVRQQGGGDQEAAA